jgi:N-acetylmuramoyl-L-alanine amidase
VSPSLAAAVAWQESGFNNGIVSSANARGAMQILPGTWSWIEDTLAPGPLDPASPSDNVRAGVMYLAQLLRDTGGDERSAVAAYYQGLGSVRAHGLLEETQHYVESVMALRPRFGG